MCFVHLPFVCSCCFPFPCWVVGRWAAQVGDGVGTNLADINFQDAQALPQDACEASRIMKMIFSSKQKSNLKNTPSQTQSLILRWLTTIGWMLFFKFVLFESGDWYFRGGKLLISPSPVSERRHQKTKKMSKWILKKNTLRITWFALHVFEETTYWLDLIWVWTD